VRLPSVILIFAGLLSPVDGSVGQVNRERFLHGTVNVVLANPQGMVIAADSLLSSHGIPSPEPGQKLFQLDDYTVCTIAGFYSSKEPNPDLSLEVRSILYAFRDDIKKSPGLTVHEKTQALSFYLSELLERLASLHEAKGPSAFLPLELRTPEFLIAGYNPDGSAEIGKVALLVHATAEASSTEVLEASSVSVPSDALVWKTAGLSDAAESVLHGREAPELELSDKAMDMFYASESSDRGVLLSTRQMNQIALRVVYYSSKKHPTVIGGDPQVAIMEKGRVVAVQQHNFDDPPPPLSHTPLFLRVNYSVTNLTSTYRPFAWYAKGLFIRSSFKHMSQTLDSSFFAKNIFDDCDLFYDGGHLDFDQNNEVGNSSLFLGPNVSRNSPEVAFLLQHFQWRFVGPATVPRNYPH
jgi:hypothetical protein